MCISEAKSEWRDVINSVPQGSVGGPTHLSMYVADMVDGVNRRMIQFANDKQLWKVIRKEEDREELQKGLEKIEDWSDNWLLKFNPKKCKVLHLGSKNMTYHCISM